LALGGVVLLVFGVGIGWVALGASGPGTPPTVSPPGPSFVSALGDVSPASPAVPSCPELAAYDPAFTRLSVPELESRLRDSAVMMPSMVEQSLEGMRSSLAIYRVDKRECMYRAMLVAQLASYAVMAHSAPGGWAQGRNSTELAGLFRTVPLREPWTGSERNEVLSLLERHVISSLRADVEGDREYWRHMYYALLLQCEATDEALRNMGAPREANSCVRFRPGMP